MNIQDYEQVLLVLTVTPEVEDEVIDWLLENPSTTAFTSLPAFGHGGEHHLLSVAEQVRGKQARTQFQIALPAGNAAAILGAFNRQFSASGSHAWLIPLLPTQPAADGA